MSLDAIEILKDFFFQQKGNMIRFVFRKTSLVSGVEESRMEAGRVVGRFI